MNESGDFTFLPPLAGAGSNPVKQVQVGIRVIGGTVYSIGSKL